MASDSRRVHHKDIFKHTHLRCVAPSTGLLGEMTKLATCHVNLALEVDGLSVGLVLIARDRSRVRIPGSALCR